MTMSSADYLDEWFEFDPLKATKSASGIIGTFLGPRSPGSAYVLLHHYMGEIDGAFRAWGFQKGGTGAISESIASAARALGAEIRTDATVARVFVKDGRATGVALANGDEISAPVVVSGLDPRRTFLDLVDRAELPSDVVDGSGAIQVPRLVGQGESRAERIARVHLPAHRRLGTQDQRGARRVLDQPERRLSRAGVRRRQVRRVLAQPVHGHRDPVDDRSRNGAAGQARHERFRTVRAVQLERRLDGRQARGVRRRRREHDCAVRAEHRIARSSRRQVLTPADIERITGLSEGNIFQGELALHQLFFLRPAAQWAKYRTPIRGYWQCGAGTHPGGGIMGASGRLAALEIVGGGRMSAKLRRDRHRRRREWTRRCRGAGQGGPSRAGRRARRADRRTVSRDRVCAGIPRAIVRRRRMAAAGRRARDWARGPSVHEPAIAATVVDDGGLMALPSDPARAADVIRKYSTRDAERWAPFVRAPRQARRIPRRAVSAARPGHRHDAHSATSCRCSGSVESFARSAAPT